MTLRFFTSSYLSAARDRAHHRSPFGPDQPIVVKVLLRQGTTATVSVPINARSFIKLLYRPGAIDRQGEHAVTFTSCVKHTTAAAALRECGYRPFNACRRDYTEFAGGFEIDLRRARDRMRCAMLKVDVRGRRDPIRERLLQQVPAHCP